MPSCVTAELVVIVQNGEGDEVDVKINDSIVDGEGDVVEEENNVISFGCKG